MEKEPYDPYYRDFPSALVPARTPFTRPGRLDAGHVFIYLTSLWKRWSVLLDAGSGLGLYDEARQCLPRGISQLWLVEKCYSTQATREVASPTRARPSLTARRPRLPAVATEQPAGNLLVVLREPARVYARQNDIVSYHFEEEDAVLAAETYTRRQHRRALVGRLLWDELWL